MKKTLLLALALALAPFALKAQTAVQPQPAPLTTTNSSSTIATSGTFQSILTQVNRSTNPNALRRGCLIVNMGTSVMHVFFGAIASATTAKSVPLAPAGSAYGAGGWVNCSAPDGGVLQDQVSITGTAGDTFSAVSQ